ncbi:MAG: alpha-ketoacid dehydrogenase subunit beta [Deltaproteobacteria bacterium]|nr:alpha-ketoacid dehydrogenase subunit beta [Deltaproteobacteria bacterium]
MPNVSYLQAVREALFEEMRRDPNVIVMGEDVGVMGGAFLATEGLHKEFGADRVIDTPISEELIVGAGIGAALAGLRPVVEMQFMDFISCGFDQIVNMAATTRYRHGGRARVPMVVRGPSGAGVRGALFHSQDPEAWFFRVPGLKVVAPATAFDAKGLLKSAIRDDDPVIFFEHKRLYRRIKEEIPEGEVVVPLGKAATRRTGKDLLFVTYGGALEWSLEAAERLAQEDKVQVEVIDLRTLLPFDLEAILEAVRRINRVVLIQEDRLTGGIASEISARIAEEAFDWLDAPIARVASLDAPMPYHPAMEAYVLPNADKVVARAREILAY